MMVRAKRMIKMKLMTQTTQEQSDPGVQVSWTQVTLKQDQIRVTGEPKLMSEKN